MPTDRELDQLIDAALPSYSAAEPQPGLEHRILSLTLAEPRHQKSLLWVWTLAIPVLAGFLIFLTWPRHPVPHTGSTARATNANTSTPPTEAGIYAKAPLAPTRHGATHLHSGQQPEPLAPEDLPKQDVFPSQYPLTAEEQTLVAYNRARLRATTTHPVAQLEINPRIISELQIQPLDIPALDTPAPDPSQSGSNDQQP